MRRRGRPCRAGLDAPGPKGVCAPSTCAHAGRRHRQSPDRGRLRLGARCARTPGARRCRGTRGREGGTDARAPGPRRRCRHFVSSAQWERVTAERGSEAGERVMNQELGRGDRREAGSAGLLRPCHHDTSAGTALRGRTGGGGAKAGAGPAAATLELTLLASPSRTAAAAALLPQPAGVSPQKPRGAHRAAESNCNGEKRRRRSRGRGRAGGRARAGEVRDHVTRRSPTPSPPRCCTTQA